jgi:hypothetical protein
MSRAYQIRMREALKLDTRDDQHEGADMSRAYRIRVRETLNRDIVASDQISTCLELLDILPQDQMADLLARELQRRGFESRDGKLYREQDGVRVIVDPHSGQVTIEAEQTEHLQLQAEGEGRAWDDVGPSSDNIRKQLSKNLRKDLERLSEEETNRLQQQASEKLEASLDQLRRELDEVVNRVTAEALKQKAASLGQIKELTEDERTGSLTIKLEL